MINNARISVDKGVYARSVVCTLIPIIDENERGRLFVALLEFAETGEVPKVGFRSKMSELVYTVLMDGLLRDREHYLEICEKNRLRAEKRWAKEREKNAT